MNTNNKRLIRVLHTESSPSLGGQELRILLEMEAMAGDGFESWLIARPHTPIVTEAEKRQLNVETINIRSTIDPIAITKFWRFLRSHKIDVVNAHNSKDAWNVSLAARLLGIPIIRSRHIANPIRSGKHRQLIYGPLCDKVMTTSKSIRQAMIDKGVDPAKIVSIPTGVDVERYASGTPGRFRAALGIPADVPLIGQIAVLRGSKGPHIFMEAALQLIAEGSPAWFVMVGDGPSRSRMERMLAAAPTERIILAGHRNDIPDVLADLDIAVLSATQPEGVPQAVLQAFAAGVPLIASDLGGINEVAINGVTAMTLPAGNSIAIAMAITEMLANPNQRQANANRARQLANSEYSREVMIQKMLLIYGELANTSQQSLPSS